MPDTGGTVPGEPQSTLPARFARLPNHKDCGIRLKAASAVYFAWYNFCRTHRTIRCTPAMEAKITDHICSIEELLGADREANHEQAA